VRRLEEVSVCRRFAATSPGPEARQVVKRLLPTGWDPSVVRRGRCAVPLCIPDATPTKREAPTHPIRLRIESGESAGLDLRFDQAFRIGRDPACEVQVTSSLVSRFHAEVIPESGRWWARDLGSTNGLLLNGERIDRSELRDGDSLQLGKGAPVLLCSLHPTAEAPGAPSDRKGLDEPTVGRHREVSFPLSVPDLDTDEGLPSDGFPGGGFPGEGVPVPPTAPAGAGGEHPPSSVKPDHEEPQLSLSEIEDKYLNPDSAQPAGQRTQLIRMAYGKVRKKERRKASLILGAVAVMLVGSLAYGLYQRHRVRVLDRQAAELFRTMKSYEVQLVGLRQLAEESGSSQLEAQLERIDSLRREVMADYDGYVRDRGLYRKLRTREEQLILRTARLFGESEFEVSGAFVDAVLREIQGYWLTPGGRNRFRQGLERAEREGYTGRIVSALRRQGVPPEFVFLALQESDFNVNAVGPPTRWGHAKGMWQFIPATAERYGLTPGPLSETGQRDPQDQRHDFPLSTDAASRYLRDLHGTLTQASGLLVMAAYNWGEHRVQPRLESLPTPTDVFQAEFAEVPANPSSRNYWTFLSEYGDRMPEETKDYVIKIFAAAVIGQDPRHFGFDFGNPLEPYVD
jgi:membrane-bound lytic murein transglycosylase D